MNATSETKTVTTGRVEPPTSIVLGVLLQFLSTPEQIKDQISVMRGTLSPGAVITTNCVNMKWIPMILPPRPLLRRSAFRLDNSSNLHDQSWRPRAR